MLPDFTLDEGALLADMFGLGDDDSPAAGSGVSAPTGSGPGTGTPAGGAAGSRTNGPANSGDADSNVSMMHWHPGASAVQQQAASSRGALSPRLALNRLSGGVVGCGPQAAQALLGSSAGPSPQVVLSSAHGSSGHASRVVPAADGSAVPGWMPHSARVLPGYGGAGGPAGYQQQQQQHQQAQPHQPGSMMALLQDDSTPCMMMVPSAQQQQFAPPLRQHWQHAFCPCCPPNRPQQQGSAGQQPSGCAQLGAMHAHALPFAGGHAGFMQHPQQQQPPQHAMQGYGGMSSSSSAGQPHLRGMVPAGACMVVTSSQQGASLRPGGLSLSGANPMLIVTTGSSIGGGSVGLPVWTNGARPLSSIRTTVGTPAGLAAVPVGAAGAGPAAAGGGVDAAAGAALGDIHPAALGCGVPGEVSFPAIALTEPPKRKRGRPRKNPLPVPQAQHPFATSAPLSAMHNAAAAAAAAAGPVPSGMMLAPPGAAAPHGGVRPGGGLPPLHMCAPAAARVPSYMQLMPPSQLVSFGSWSVEPSAAAGGERGGRGPHDSGSGALLPGGGSSSGLSALHRKRSGSATGLDDQLEPRKSSKVRACACRRRAG
jgi:hypothetical protein